MTPLNIKGAQGLLKTSLALLMLVALTISSVMAVSLGRWEQVKIKRGSPPLERPFHSCELDQSGKRIIVFGGRTGVTSFSNTFFSYSISDRSWSKLNVETISTPQAELKQIPTLAGHSMTLIGDKMYVFGGRSGVFDYNQDLYVLDVQGEILRKVITTGDKPGSLQSHSASAFGECIIVYGGTDGSVKNGLFVLNTTSSEWKSISVPESPYVQGHKSIIHDGKLYIVGGSKSEEEYNPDIHVLELPTTCAGLTSGTAKLSWTTTKVGGKMRSFHTANILDNKVFVYGGMTSKQTLDDTKVYDLKREKWLDETTIDNSDLIPARRGHCSVVKGHQIFVFGGSFNKKNYNDVWVLDTKPELSTKPAPVDGKKEFSELVESAVATVADLQEITVDTTESDSQKSENELRSLIADDQEDNSSSLVKRIAQWNRIEALFLELQNNKAKVQNLTENLKYEFEDIDALADDYNSQLGALKNISESLNERLQELKETEDKVANKEKNIKDLNMELQSINAAIAELENAMAQTKSAYNAKNRQREKAVKEREQLEKRLEELDVILSTAADIQKDSEDREKAKLLELEKIREEISALTVEVDAYTQEVAELQKKLTNIDRKLTRIENEVINAAESVKKKYLEQLRLKESYEKSKDELLSKILEFEEDDDEKAEMLKKKQQQERDDELKKYEQMIENQKTKLLKAKQDVSSKLQSFSNDLKKRVAKLKELREEEEKILAELARLRDRITEKTNEKQSSAIEKEKLNKLLDDKSDAARSLEIDTAALKDTLDTQDITLKGKKDSAQTIASELDAETVSQGVIKSSLDELNAQLKEKYDKVNGGLNALQKLSDKITAMKRAAALRGSAYSEQRADYVKFKSELEKAVQEADKMFLDRIKKLEDEIQALKSSKNEETKSDEAF